MGTLDRFVFRVLEARRLVGIPTLLWSAIAWRVRQSYLVLTCDLRQPLPSVPVVAGLRWMRLRDEDVRQLLLIDPSLTGDEIARRRREGQLCTLGWLDGVLVYYRWETTGPRYHLAYLGKTLDARDGDMAVSKVFTAPAFRHRGIGVASLERGLREARGRGHRRAITFVAPLNRPSRRICECLGFQAVGAVGYWNAGIRRVYFATGDAALEGGNRLIVR